MATSRLRAFVIGFTRADAEALANRLRSAGAHDIVGLASQVDVERGVALVPHDVDIVVASPAVFPRHNAAGSAATLVETLTPREHRVLSLAADGLPNREIAAALEISEHTVKFHLASIYGKLDVGSRTEAVRRGLQLGLIDL